MAFLSSISFAAPWVLLALAVLPAIWWLLRVNPPVPQRIKFPAIRLLMGLQNQEQTPTTTPPWLLILRLILAALLILAISGPLHDEAPRLVGAGPLVIVVDDGWAAAPSWNARIKLAEQLIDQADRADKNVVLVFTAPRILSDATEPAPYISNALIANDARLLLRASEPLPWPVDRAAAATALASSPLPPGADIAWLSDGLVGRTAGGAAALSEQLRRAGRVRIYQQEPWQFARLVGEPTRAGSDLLVPVKRPNARLAETQMVRLKDDSGNTLARQAAEFGDFDVEASATFTLPDEVRRRVAIIDLETQASAGAVSLVDRRWQLDPVGLISGSGFEENQPLLSEIYYLERALQPVALVHHGSMAELLASEVSVLVLADVGRVNDADRADLEAWIERGGVLVRFAGPRMADGADDLVPVDLIGGGERTLGGALSWDSPMALAAFPDASPFSGLVPPDDVLVYRQVLAQPGVDLSERTWARLRDGTPLVTAQQRGKGRIVLFHTTANTEWSSFALSGLFVQMLERMVLLGTGGGDALAAQTLLPLNNLDGFGRLGPASPQAVALPIGDDLLSLIGPRNPPGLYGEGGQRLALNLGEHMESITALPPFEDGLAVSQFGVNAELDLTPWILVVAFVLLIADCLIAMHISGLLTFTRMLGGKGSVLAILGATAVFSVQTIGDGRSAAAQELQADGGLTEESIVESIKRPHLAYVLTADADVDRISRDGLTGLSNVLRQRTSIEPGFPIGVDLETDPLDFYPLIYWPMTDSQAVPSDSAMSKLLEYMRLGGMVLIDTRDQSPAMQARAGSRDRAVELSQFLSRLNLPPLVRVPKGHALGQAFYLLEEFPGRYEGSPLWVERYEGDVNDGVSSVIIGGHDWASAWALDERGVPKFPVVPGGERQREMAFRFGVNLTMYAMTGNYKADQVHISSILRRLGRLPEDDPRNDDDDDDD